MGKPEDFEEEAFYHLKRALTEELTYYYETKELPRYLSIKKLHFGFTIGINTMDFKITRSMNPHVEGTDTSFLYPELNSLVPGFHVGIVSNLRLTEYLDLRFSILIWGNYGRN